MTLANRLEPAETASRLEAWLGTRLPDAEGIRVDGVESVRSSGFSTEALMFDVSWREGGRERSERLAARVHPVGDGLFPDYDLEQEARVMSALAERSSLPVPKLFLREPDEDVLGAPFLVMERIDGRTLGDDPPYTTEGWLVELPPEDQRRVYENMLRAIAELHAVDPATLGLGDVGPPDAGPTPLDRQLAYMERYARFAGVGEPDGLVSRAIGWLKDNHPADQEEAVLCWGDARCGNVIFADDLSVAGTLDWEEAALARPELDLGYFLFALRALSEGVGAPLPPGFLDRQETVARYEELSGRKVANLDYYEVVAGVRGVLILTRMARMMTEAGFIPADSDMPTNNPTTHLLAAMLDLPAPSGEATDWVGHRD